MGEHPGLTSLEQNSAGRDPVVVSEIFGAIARRYDLANHLLSCGCDFYWRKRAAEIVAGWRPKQIVDLATGTGDLALVLEKKMPDTEITAADFSEEMLAIAKQKGVRHTMLADILALPFADRSFDCATIAFGLRNVQDWNAGLREIARVIRDQGHVLVLEFSLPQLSLLRAAYRFYLHRCMPLIGAILTRKKNAYDYLGDSIEQFPNGSAMLRLMEANGFTDAKAEPLTGGIVTIYTGAKR
jgi:demethylmenaquinone methyltransferase/2-methoxy-6-polyprenyl-1,4-benzoquinol methylase